jgi:hypothetical protein
MKKTATITASSILLSILTFCTSCQYMPEALRELGGLRFKESVEIDIPQKASNIIPQEEFPEHCDKNVDKQKL